MEYETYQEFLKYIRNKNYRDKNDWEKFLENDNRRIRKQNKRIREHETELRDDIF